MGKIKSKTVTDEYDEQGVLISHWENTEYYPEPEIFQGNSIQASGGVAPNACPCNSCQGEKRNHGILRS